MRFADLIGLALSALRQQKVRTALTTLGVVFGSLVLTVSLSIRGGVQETIQREYSRHGELRQMVVMPLYTAEGDGPPPEKLEIRGKVNDERRRRLLDEIRNRWPGSGERRVKAPLTKERIAAIAALEHVRGVRPSHYMHLTAHLGDRSDPAEVTPAPPGTAALTGRLVAGRDLSAAGAREVLVTEYLLYRLGVIKDADVEAAVGKSLRLESRTGGHQAGPLVSLLNGAGAKLSAKEAQALARILPRVPEALGKLDLTDEEKGALNKLLEAPRPAPPKEVVIAEEFTIRGVLRPAEGGLSYRRDDWEYRQAEVFLSPRAGEALFYRLPHGDDGGVHEVVVEADDTAHVKRVSETIQAMGLRVRARAEDAEREQFIYVLIFTGMTLVAAVALLVAALGIVNTMLMSVLERVREIGVMKAVGARGAHIRTIFLVEGALLGLVGGALGVALGWAASFPGDAWTRGMVEQQFKVRLSESLFIFPWWLVVGVPLFACLVTTLAAYYPARRASRVNPIAALRHD